MRFRVIAPDVDQSFERWIDALELAKSLIPKCKGLFQEVRIFDHKELVWVSDRFHRYPQFIGPGTYKRLALLLIQETLAAEAEVSDSSTTPESTDPN